MSIVRATVTFDHVSALPEDQVVNTFHFDSGTLLRSTATNWDAIDAALIDFYTHTQTTGGLKVVNLLSRNMVGTATIRQYDLGDAKPRVPVRVTAMPFSPQLTDNALPEEVALVMSFSGPLLSGTVAARRRGRVYLGPINGNRNGSDGRPTTVTLQTIQQAGGRLINDAGTIWAVYSPTSDPNPTFSTVGLFVDHGWVDNGWDTQRRRGRAATSRLTFV